MASFEQYGDNVLTDKARCAGYQYSHEITRSSGITVKNLPDQAPDAAILSIDLVDKIPRKNEDELGIPVTQPIW